MQIEKQELESMIKDVVKATLTELGIGTPVSTTERSAYNKTELLLWNYKNFQRVIKEKQEEIEELRKYGVPHKGSAVHTYCGDNNVHGLLTVEETVENAVHTVQESVQELTGVLYKIDTALKSMQFDQYFPILKMRYFDGMSQEDIANVLDCTQPNVSKNKTRLVRELSLRLFPTEVIKEMTH